MSEEMSMEKPFTGHAASNGTDLSRQVTVALSSDQYERLFFQPSGAKGDLAKRLGNPTLLGVLGFFIPFTITMFSILEWKGTNATSLAADIGPWYFFGGVAMNIAGICEFILGNTFPFSVFVVYGCHWVATAYVIDPWHPLAAAYYQAAGGAAESQVYKPYTSAQGHYYVTMAIVSFIFLIGSLRTNGPFVLVFFCLLFIFGLIAGGQYELGYNPTPEGLEYASRLFQIAGGFGFVVVIAGIYLAIILVCASTGVPCPLPIFDLSQRVAPHSKAQTNEHAGVVQRGSVPGV